MARVSPRSTARAAAFRYICSTFTLDHGRTVQCTTCPSCTATLTDPRPHQPKRYTSGRLVDTLTDHILTEHPETLR